MDFQHLGKSVRSYEGGGGEGCGQAGKLGNGWKTLQESRKGCSKTIEQGGKVRLRRKEEWPCGTCGGKNSLTAEEETFDQTKEREVFPLESKKLEYNARKKT